MSALFDKLSSKATPETEVAGTCPLCGAEESEFLFWAIDRLHHLPGKFGEVLCKECELVRLSPRPTEQSLAYYYPEDDYYSYSQIPTFPDLNARTLKEDIRRAVLSEFNYPVKPNSLLVKFLGPIVRSVFTDQATFGNSASLPKWVPNGKALDVGCGSGTFLAVLKQLGWSVQGVELSQAAADAAKSNLDIDVFVGDLKEAGFADSEFDFISFNHSLEHLPDIVGVLTEVRRILRPGGRLYIEVPNVASTSRRLSGPYWLHWDAPRHLYGFTPKSLSALLKKAGFSNIRSKTIRANLYGFDIMYRREDKLGARLEDRSKLLGNEKVRAACVGLITRISNSIFRNSGDYISCFATNEK
jgi:SAM-dependent methyltransferase